MKTTNYILGMDGGGTKTVARLVNTQTGQSWQSQGGPSSLSLGVQSAVDVIAQQAEVLAQQAGIKLSDVSLLCGLAGASEHSLCQTAQQRLNPHFAQVEICSDAKTSAWGANQGAPVAVVALGTGSVAMELNEQGTETLIGGWGLLAGDEGSGARFGLHAIHAFLWELDSNQALSATGRYLGSMAGLQRTDILRWLRTAKSTDFAALLPAIWQLQNHCTVAQALVQQHLQAVIRLIGIMDTKLPLMMIGGLADITAPLLPASIQQRMRPALGDALDGACILAEQLFAPSGTCNVRQA
ncbi:BadF/BadG/BcrA/BcrD ATPase family protein [Alkalimonas sp.]|uniref:BadF/BadG/BcrA/BcrD ATPase family protein n=1 Tax=Alkalimonas sp. TaxID=1872453 RepID=UPI00263B4AB5|nr:BadF/BadG/BcrA/BcrD ATPase family protein [Alkalimonas sp.]MCC5827215.1 ATPase [Alkalimonas sp.]